MTEAQKKIEEEVNRLRTRVDELSVEAVEAAGNPAIVQELMNTANRLLSIMDLVRMIQDEARYQAREGVQKCIARLKAKELALQEQRSALPPELYQYGGFFQARVLDARAEVVTQLRMDLEAEFQTAALVQEGFWDWPQDLFKTTFTFGTATGNVPPWARTSSSQGDGSWQGFSREPTSQPGEW